jgi:Fe(3+) dicitrate transport protein
MRLKEFSGLLLFLLTFPVWGQLSISGSITNEEGKPLPDVEVYLRELERLEMTDANGVCNF